MKYILDHYREWPQNYWMLEPYEPEANFRQAELKFTKLGIITHYQPDNLVHAECPWI